MSDEYVDGSSATGNTDADYEVGYGKPPRQHRFKPGNQVARKRKKPAETNVSLAEVMSEALKRRIKVKKGEKFVNLTVAEIFIERLVQAMTRGSTKDMIAVFALFKQYAPDALEAEAPAFELLYRRAVGSTVELPPANLYDLEMPK